MNYDEKTEQKANSLATSIEVYNAIRWIADLDNYSAKKLWENGYTDKHSYNEVDELIKQYIRENIPVDEIDSKYYWGDGEPIVMNEIESLCKMKSIKDSGSEADEYVNRIEFYAEQAYNDQREW